jgi:hypothetical protein
MCGTTVGELWHHFPASPYRGETALQPISRQDRATCWPKKPFRGSWRLIGRYQHAANLGVAVPEHPYKDFHDDPGLAEKTGSRILCFDAPDFCPYWAWPAKAVEGPHPGNATVMDAERTRAGPKIAPAERC